MNEGGTAGAAMPARDVAPPCLRRAETLPALIVAAGDQAARRFLEFFTATIRNPHTRRAYGRACGEFLAWCAAAGVRELADVEPLHVATWMGL
jgi:hypothetical protein